MNENLKDYFYFSRGEKNGILILLVVIVILIGFPYFYGFLSDSSKQDLQKFDKEIEQFTASLEEVEEPAYKSRLDQYIIERYDSIKLFFFNPNTTSKEDFFKLGLTDKQVKTIFNYREKGGKFTVKDDFKKIYGIRQQQFQILKPFILLPDNEQYSTSEFDRLKSNPSEENITGTPTVFNPNTCTDEEFKKLGLNDDQIKTIRNYLNKIGKFKSKEDFKKIYGLSEEKYNQLEPYIYIVKNEEKTKESIRLELNSASAIDLEKLKGIGQYTASAIIKYRQKLGGFISIDQLLEIKNITTENFELFKSNLFVDQSKIIKISLNFAEVEDFASHPYLNYNQAKEIVKFRTTNGPYQDKKQLLQNKILMENSYKKIEPYLSLN